MAEATRTPLKVQITEGNLYSQIQIAFASAEYYFSPQHSTSSTSTLHAAFAFILPVFFSFLQLKYVGKESSPFQTHPKSIGLTLFCLAMYCFAYEAHLRSEPSLSHRRTSTYAAAVAGRGMAVFGSLALVSLTSILLADSLFVPILYLVYVLFFASKLLLWLCSYPFRILWNWLHRIIPGGFLGRARGLPLAFSSNSSIAITSPV